MSTVRDVEDIVTNTTMTMTEVVKVVKMADTITSPMYEWNTIPWAKAERAVFKLQKRIYQASKHGDTQTVHKLQRLLMKSWWACLLAVRKVTQDNAGKKTAGVDGVKSLQPRQRFALAQQLQ